MTCSFPVSCPPRNSPVLHHERVVKASREFEAQLLSSLLAPLEKSFSALPGEESPPGGDDYGYMGIQALAAALSGSGGIGIADLVLRQLAQTEVRSADPGEAGREAPGAVPSHSKQGASQMQATTDRET